ncbi:hypothetical protein CCR91_18450 [Thiorhodovibrio winogradskyi]|nr:hypothetical protein [Thiorhodovibrio winogradskyi]
MVISIANHYAKLRGRLRELAAAHPELAPRPFDAGGDGGNGLGGKTASQASSGVGSETASSAGNATQSQIGRDGALIQDLAHLAGEHGLEIRGCAEEFDLRRWGVQPGKCIDDELIRRLFQLPAPTRKDKSQRAVCGCVESRDIGMYDSCLFGCVYCYATRSFATARHNHAHHDPHAESLIGDYRAPPPVTRSSAPLPSPAL